MDIKLSKAQLSKKIQSDGFFSKTVGNTVTKLGRRALLNFGAHLAKNILPQLATKEILSLIDKLEENVSSRGAVRTGKVFTLFISKEDMDDTLNL